MKLSEVIAIWEELYVKDTGDLGYYDLENAIGKICGIDMKLIKEIKPHVFVTCPARKGHKIDTIICGGCTKKKCKHWKETPGDKARERRNVK